MSTALDNGLTATVSTTIDVLDGDIDDVVGSEDFIFSLFSEAANLQFCDLDPVAEDRFNGVDGATVRGFADQDAIYGFVASATVANVDLALSFLDDGAENSIGLSIGYPFGPITVGCYYSINDVDEDNYDFRANYALNGFLVNAEYNVDAGENDERDVDDYLIEGSYHITEQLQLFAGYLGGNDEPDRDLLCGWRI